MVLYVSGIETNENNDRVKNLGVILESCRKVKIEGSKRVYLGDDVHLIRGVTENLYGIQRRFSD